MSQEKTEKPTAKKIKDARQRGDIACSRDLVHSCILIVLLGFIGFIEFDLDSFKTLFIFPDSSYTKHFELVSLNLGLRIGAGLLIPFLFIVFFVGCFVSFCQIGPLFTWKPLIPKLDQLSPSKGFKKLVCETQFVELVKLILKASIIVVIGYHVFIFAVQAVLKMVRNPFGSFLSFRSLDGIQMILRERVLDIFYVFLNTIRNFGWNIGITFLFLSFIDFFYQKWHFFRIHKMSLEEQKQEHRMQEGDPTSKQARQGMHREILEHHILEGVRSSDIVIINPIHIAVALRYREKKDSAPYVVARGETYLARKMIMTAEEAGVMVVQDVSLARDLFQLEVGQYIS